VIRVSDWGYKNRVYNTISCHKFIHSATFQLQGHIRFKDLGIFHNLLVPMDYGKTTEYSVSVELGLLTPPLIGQVVTTHVELCTPEGYRSTLDVDGIGVFVDNTLEIQGLETVSAELIENDLK